MKFIVDTERKLITLEESANLANFVEVIEKMLGDQWKEYTLEKTVMFDWSYRQINIQPIVIPYTPTYPSYPTYPIITYSSRHFRKENQM